MPTGYQLYIANKTEAIETWSDRDRLIDQWMNERHSRTPNQTTIDELSFQIDVRAAYAKVCEMLASMYYNDPATWTRDAQPNQQESQ